VWEARRNSGLGVVDEPGTFSWAEVMAKDLARSATLYTSLFGWGPRGDPRHTEWTLGALGRERWPADY
jgi:predicted enzyme related to lactoylglutathione lyase